MASLRRVRHPALPVLGVFAAGAIAAVLVGVLRPATEETSAGPVEAVRPNVLIVVTDDQNIRTMAVMKRTRRRLGNQGARYPRAFLVNPQCCPSRASIMSGLYSHNHGVTNNYRVERFDHETTLQRHLSQAGYHTAIFGKFLNGWGGAPPYFDRWAYNTGSNRYSGALWNVDGTVQTIADYNADYISDRAVEYLNDRETANDAQPWLMYLTPLGPHAPSTPAPRHADAPVPAFRPNPATNERNVSDKPPYVRALGTNAQKVRRIAKRQYRSMLAVDELIARVDRALADLGEKGNTIVFFLTDNGYTWKEHRLLGPRMVKNNPYKFSVKTPFLVRWPEGIAAGRVDRRLVSNVDIAPTIYDAAGVPRNMYRTDGKSLLRTRWDRDQLLLEHFAQKDLPIPRWAALRTKRYQYVEYYRNGRIGFREFYRFSDDPWQLRNLLNDGRKANDPNVASLHRRLRRVRDCSGNAGTDPCP